MIEARYSVSEVVITSIIYGLTKEELNSALMGEAIFDWNNWLDIGLAISLTAKYYG